MRLGTNLALHPFRSFARLYALGGTVLLVAAVALGLEIWDVQRSIARGRSAGARARELQAQIDRDERGTAMLQPLLDPKELKRAAREASQVERLIQRRLFDWDHLLTALEMVVPNNVRLTVVEPAASDRSFRVLLRGNAKGLADLNDLVDRLEQSPAFERAFVRSQSTKGGEVDFEVDAVYVPSGGALPDGGAGAERRAKGAS